jgi:Plavaka transposase
MSANKIDELMEIWADQQLGEHDDDSPSPPFANARDLYNVIDATELGDVPWEGFAVTYDGDVPDNAPSWMSTPYEVWFRDPLLVMESQIGNRDFGNEMDYAPKRVFSRTRTRQFCDLMSGDWAWNQAVRLFFLRIVFCNSNSVVGYHCGRSRNAWCHVCTCDSG